MTNKEFMFQKLGKIDQLDLGDGVFDIVAQAFNSGYNIGALESDLLHQKILKDMSEKHQNQIDGILKAVKSLK